MAGPSDGRDPAARHRLAPAPDPAGPPPDGRVALVGDGDRGPGLHVVTRLAELGMRVVLGSRSVESGRSAVGRLGALAERVAVRHLDPADPASVERLAGWMDARLGRCDVLVGDTSGVVQKDSPGASADLEAVRHAAERVLLGPWRLAQAVAPMMRAAGYGRVVLLGSGERPRDPAVYRVCRAAVATLATTLAKDLAGDGILVNGCWAGPVEAVPRGGPRPLETPVWLATLPNDGPTGQLFAWLARRS